MIIKKLEIKEHNTYKQPKTRIYFWPEGESVMENLTARHNRPHKLFRKYLPLVLSKAGYTDEEAAEMKAVWNVHAGCSMCPCSPGFVLNGKNDSKFESIHITVSL